MLTGRNYNGTAGKIGRQNVLSLAVELGDPAGIIMVGNDKQLVACRIYFQFQLLSAIQYCFDFVFFVCLFACLFVSRLYPGQKRIVYFIQLGFVPFVIFQ